MAETIYNDEFLEWDDEIQDDSSFTLLEEGDYDFKVTSFERGTTKKDGSRMAVLTFEVGEPGARTTIKDYLVLKKSVEWKISAFFRAVGMKKHGQRIRMDFKGSIGKTGKCHVIVDEYTNRNGDTVKSNKISGYYDMADWLDDSDDNEQEAPWVTRKVPWME